MENRHVDEILSSMAEGLRKLRLIEDQTCMELLSNENKEAMYRKQCEEYKTKFERLYNYYKILYTSLLGSTKITWDDMLMAISTMVDPECFK